MSKRWVVTVLWGWVDVGAEKRMQKPGRMTVESELQQQYPPMRCFVPLSWENLRLSACRNILFILTSVVTLVRGGCLAAGAIFSA